MTIIRNFFVIIYLQWFGWLKLGWGYKLHASALNLAANLKIVVLTTNFKPKQTTITKTPNILRNHIKYSRDLNLTPDNMKTQRKSFIAQFCIQNVKVRW